MELILEILFHLTYYRKSNNSYESTLESGNRRIIVIILILLTLVLGGVSLYIGLNVGDTSETTAPTDADAAGGCIVNGVDQCDDSGRSYCGLACNSDSDCIPQGSNGAATQCLNGLCVSTTCESRGGTTRVGVNCDCDGNIGKCGEICGPGYPLCGAGTTCGFITTAAQCLEAEGDETQQFCIPTDPANGYDTAQCIGIGARYLVGKNGESPTTQAQLQEACSLCGNGETDAGEECDDGESNGTAFSNCTTSCVFKPECSDGRDNDGDGKTDCTAGNPDPGCFPDGRGGGGACNPNDDNENDVGAPPQCSDGADNDGDGKIDCQTGNEDPGCFPNGRGGGGACNPNDNSEQDALPATAIPDGVPLELIIGGGLLGLGFILYKNSRKYKRIELRM